MNEAFAKASHIFFTKNIVAMYLFSNIVTSTGSQSVARSPDGRGQFILSRLIYNWKTALSVLFVTKKSDFWSAARTCFLSLAEKVN